MNGNEMHKDEIHLGQYIAKRVKNAQSSLGLKNFELAKLCYTAMGVKEVTASGFIGYIKKGKYHRIQPKDIWRLSVMLYTLNINENDEMIAKIRNLYDTFIYPPKIIEDESPLEEQIQKLTEKDQQFIGRLVNNILKTYEKPQNPY